MKLWFTSDQHFSHTNIIKYCQRPFSSVDEMDQVLIDEWNRVVKDGDRVYHLGDFTLGRVDQAQRILRQLNGWILILGNSFHHDKNWLGRENYLTHREWVVTYPPISVLNDAGLAVPIVLCHFPFEEWDRKHYGSLHFHGHSHGNLHQVPNRLDVGVDNAYKHLGVYRPFSLDEAVQICTLP